MLNLRPFLLRLPVLPLPILLWLPVLAWQPAWHGSVGTWGMTYILIRARLKYGSKIH